MHVGIEVKAAVTLTESDFTPLRRFAELTGKRLHRGLLLYMGSQPLAFGPQLHALPVNALWRLGAVRDRTAFPGGPPTFGT
jgi:hypothetical protein